VAGEFGVFQEEVWSPSLVPEEADEETQVSAAEVAVLEIDETMVEETIVEGSVVERVRVTEHFLAVEYIPVRVPERRSHPRASKADLIA
jgi:hypothetical protein